MSIWVSGYVRKDEMFTFNTTVNVQPMFRAALNNTFDEERQLVGLRDLDGVRCNKAAPVLALALAFMYNPENASAFEALNPSNKWGNFETARSFLHRVLNGCLAYPQARLSVV